MSGFEEGNENRRESDNMEHNENPYASPLTGHSPPAIVESRSHGFSTVVLSLDAFISLLMVAIGSYVLLAEGEPTLNDVVSLIVGLASSCLALPAFVLLIKQNKIGLTLAYVAGVSGGIPVIIVLIYVAWTGDKSDAGFALVMFGVKAAWNLAYIFAAHSFAKK